MNKSLKVFVGLSGGVDSSVAALRLKNEGYNVVGVFIKVWHPDFLVCNWESERLDAMRVAAKLDIPFLTCDAVAAYRDAVASYFIEDYRAGRTPNPDVMCNKEVKFGVFYKFAIEQGADFVATGHYAQKLIDTKSGEARLLRGIDTEKDQSYFLWTLPEPDLKNILFPVGASPKATIRKEAAAAALPTAIKKDSQGVCFLGQIDIPNFLSHYIELIPGKVLSKDGSVIGEHQGAFVYTLGQRHGFTIFHTTPSSAPVYIVAKSVAENTITVSHQRLASNAGSQLHLEKVSWRGQRPLTGATYSAQTRYRQTPFTVTIDNSTDTTLLLNLTSDIETPAVGQSCVLYTGMECHGGGIIT